MVHSVVTALVAVAATSGSGLYGRVVISPARPVCAEGQSCTAPDKNDALGFWRNGRRVATARTNAEGRYRIALRPGRYTVRAKHTGAIGRGLAPTKVVVPRAGYARVNFTLDIGIR